VIGIGGGRNRVAKLLNGVEGSKLVFSLAQISQKVGQSGQLVGLALYFGRVAAQNWIGKPKKTLQSATFEPFTASFARVTQSTIFKIIHCKAENSRRGKSTPLKRRKSCLLCVYFTPY